MRTPRTFPLELACLAALLFPAPDRAQLTSIGSQFWNQDSTGIEGAAEGGDTFGRAVAVGDFNCDGFDDLAIGSPYEDVEFDCDGDGTSDPNECANAGAVNVIYGSAVGLHPTLGHADQILTQASSGATGSPEPGDHFGWALATMRFRLDAPCADLAVGVPDEDLTFGPLTHVNAGYVNYFHGTPAGLVADGGFSQGTDGVPESQEDGDRFGAAIAQGPLVATDCATNGAETLAIGAPGEDLGLGHGNGIVILIPTRFCNIGSNGDLPAQFDCSAFSPSPPCQLLNPALSDVLGESGAALAASRIDDPSPEKFLAIGVPGWSFGNSSPGGVGILRSDSSGEFDVDLTTECNQGLDGAAGSAEDGDQIGAALAIGDFDDDGKADLAVGAPLENVNSNSVVDAGGVSVFYGGTHGGAVYPSGGGPPAAPFFDQDETHFDGAGLRDHFGAALATGDFDGDGFDDLVIGVPDEDIGSDDDAGMIHILRGGNSGLTVTGDQAFDLDDANLPGQSQEEDFFGFALASGDFDGDGRDDLAVGTPGSTSDAVGGGVFVLYGGLPGGFLDAVDFNMSSTHHAESGAWVVHVVRTGNLTQTLAVNYSHFGGTATVNSDYGDFFGTLNWDAGEAGEKTFVIPVLVDAVDEPNETIIVGLDAGGNHCREPANLTLTIDDNDPNVPGTFQFSTNHQSDGEAAGSVDVIITRTGGTTAAVQVSYATSDGTALHDLDYDDMSGSTVFSLNELSRTIQVPIIDDPWDESAIESFSIAITAVSAGSIGAVSTQTINIFDNADTGLFGDGFEHGDTVAWSAVSP